MRIGIATKFTEAKTEAKIYDIFLKKCVYIFAFFFDKIHTVETIEHCYTGVATSLRLLLRIHIVSSRDLAVYCDSG